MTIYELLKSIIIGGNYNLSDMEHKIYVCYVDGKITEEQKTELTALASESANDSAQIDIMVKLKDLEDRIFALENPTPTFAVWYKGYITKRGETVQFDIDGDGTYELVRYDGGRADTTSTPFKIEGWHHVDAEGNIIE